MDEREDFRRKVGGRQGASQQRKDLSTAELRPRGEETRVMGQDGPHQNSVVGRAVFHG